ncbi:GL18880 [Drosophila persimilis]|uniref:GL18880 n=1 Tax=Drosophila persimilis TaxID=7234 RepID=B4G893_DROPE|nr:GL18880 [Drosophila persimilis]
MSPKYHHFEIALVYFLLLIPWPPTNVIKILCSRDNSRLVRKIVRSKWTPILDKHQVKLPLECPLHPFRDVFAPRQDAKQRDRPTQWTCRRCGKSFYQERHLDLHFDTRHKTIINEAMDSICLADFCDIMRCEVFETEDATSLKFGDHIVTDIEVWGDSLGQNSALAKANAAYLSLIPRTSTLGASRAAKVQNRQLLQEKPIQSSSSSSSSKEQQSPAGEHSTPSYPHPRTHTHTRRHSSVNPLRLDPAGEDGSAARPKSAGEKLLKKLKELGLKRGGDSAEGDSETKLNETEEEEEQSGDDAEASGQQDPAKMEEGSGNGNGVKARANCKPEELSKLKTRCELLLRSCIGGLLLSMSDQAFKEMEEEMNKAVCWYLTCDRYWEGWSLGSRAPSPGASLSSSSSCFRRESASATTSSGYSSTPKRRQSIPITTCREGSAVTAAAASTCPVPTITTMSTMRRDTTSTWTAAGYLVACLLYNSALDRVIYARDKWLKPNGCIFPDTARLYLSVAEDRNTERPRHFWSRFLGFNMSHAAGIVQQLPKVGCVLARQILAKPQEIWKMDLRTIKSDQLSFKVPFQLLVQRQEIIDLFVVHFDFSFSGGTDEKVVSTSPWAPSTHWQQTLFHIDQHLPICRGEKFSGNFSVSRGANYLDFDIEWGFRNKLVKIKEHKQIFRLGGGCKDKP